MYNNGGLIEKEPYDPGYVRGRMRRPKRPGTRMVKEGDLGPKKVKCKNCKFEAGVSYSHALGGYCLACRVEVIPAEINPYNGEIIAGRGQLKRASVLNLDGNCKKYKRKWWKFWA